MARYNTAPQTLTVTGATTFSYAFTGGIISLTGTPGYTVDLVSPVFFPGSRQTFYNATAGTITLATPAGQITGNGVTIGTTIDIPTNSTYVMTSDGTNYVLTSALAGTTVFELPVTLNDTATFNGQVDIISSDAAVTISPSGGSGTVTISPSQSATIQPAGALVLKPLGTGTLELNTSGGTLTIGSASVNTAVAGTMSVADEATLASATISDLTSGRVVYASTSGSLVDSGNLTFNGTTLTANTLTVSNTAAVNGNFAVNTNKFTVDSATGNTSVAGTLGVTGAATFASNVGVTGTLNSVADFSVNTNKFNVTASNGNTTVAGTLGVTGASTLASISATSITTTGNASFGGTLGVTSTSTFTGAATFNGGVNIGTGNSLAEYIADTVGAMVSSNTESGISVTYQDADNTLDFDVGDFTITLTGDVTGTGTVTNLGNVSFATTIAANSVALGTDTTGNYVAGLTAGTGVSISGTAGEGWSPTVAIGQAVATTSNVQFNSLGVGTAASTTAGEIRATNGVTAYYSDERLKKNITPIANALSKVLTLRGVTYNANEIAESFGYNSETEEVGVLAGDVKNVLPQAVKPAPFDIMLNDEGIEVSKSGQNYMTVQYERIIPLLVEAIKEQQEQIEQLKIALGR